MVSSVRVGLLPGSIYLKERLISVIATFDWDVTQLSRDAEIWRQPVQYDIAVLAVDKVTSATLAWLARTASETPTPIIVVAQHHDPQTIADVLRAGADDFIAHPYASEELGARIENLIIRSRRFEPMLATETVELDHGRRLIREGQCEVAFTEREWSLLALLLEREGHALSLTELAKASTIPTESAVVSAISRMRKRLEKASFRSIVIETIYGRGYAAQVRSRISDMQQQCCKDRVSTG